MYSYIGSDGKPHLADLDHLKEWAKAGYVEPYAAVVDTATGLQTRADALPELQPMFAARFEAMARQTADAAVKSPLSTKTKVLGGAGIAALATVLVLIVSAVNGWGVFEKPYHHPPLPPRPPQGAWGAQHYTPSGTPRQFKPEYMPGPMPEKERKAIYWELGMILVNSGKALDKRFPPVPFPRHPSPADIAHEHAQFKQREAYMNDWEAKTKKSLAKKSKLSLADLDLITNEGMDKAWPFPLSPLSHNYSY